MSNWFYDKEITLLTETDGFMSHGSWVAGNLSVSKTITCDVQPANRELIFKEYGYYIDCNYRIFCDIDSAITLGAIIRYDTDYFTVDKIIAWDDYFDMFINEYKGVVNLG